MGPCSNHKCHLNGLKLIPRHTLPHLAPGFTAPCFALSPRPQPPRHLTNTITDYRDGSYANKYRASRDIPDSRYRYRDSGRPEAASPDSRYSYGAPSRAREAYDEHYKQYTRENERYSAGDEARRGYGYRGEDEERRYAPVYGREGYEMRDAGANSGANSGMFDLNSYRSKAKHSGSTGRKAARSGQDMWGI